MLAIGADDVATVDVLLDIARSNDRIEMEANAKQTDDAQEKTQKMEDDLERTETEKVLEDQIGDNDSNSHTKTEPPSNLLNLISGHRNSAGLSCILLSAIMPTTKMLQRMIVAAEECGCPLGGLVSTQGNNILHCAAAGGSVGVVKMIERYDYNLALHLARQRNEKAKLPKHIAKYWKHYDALTALMDLETGMTLPNDRSRPERRIRNRRSKKK